MRELDNNSGGRELWAATPVSAPPEMVWRTLTDYERLAGVVRLRAVTTHRCSPNAVETVDYYPAPQRPLSAKDHRTVAQRNPCSMCNRHPR